MKRFIGLLLTVLLVFSLVSPLGLNANAGDSYQISFDKESYEVGESIWVTITCTNAGNLDWVGLFAPGDKYDGTNLAIAWQYVSSINGKAVDFRNDAAGDLNWFNSRSEWYGFPAGTYTIVVFENGSYNIITQATFTVNAPAGTPTVNFSFDKESYEVGDTVNLTINAANIQSGSWLGIYAPGGGASSYGWTYIDGTFNRTISLVPGNTELDYWNKTAPFYSGTWSVVLNDAANQVIGSAASFTVNAPAGQPEPSYQLSLSKDGENPTYYICQGEDPTFTVNAENYGDKDWIAIHCADETPGGSLPSIKYAYISDINGQAINIRTFEGWIDSPTRIGHKDLPATDYTIYICLNDGYAVATSISFKVRDHKSETLPAVEPTCEENGLTKGSKCELCDTVITEQQTIPALDHDWGEWSITTPASCTQAGEKQRVCTRNANHIETQTIEATGHSYVPVVTAPTCTEQGYTTYTCSDCQDSYVADYVDAKGHTKAKAVVENNVAPTCETAGSYDSVVYCTDCKTELSRNNVTVDALGHDWGDWSVVAPASCTQVGEKQRICLNDSNHIQKEEIPTSGHKYAEKIIPPTCVSQGFTANICSVCGDVLLSDYVPATGVHTYTETVILEPTCEENGIMSLKCSVCADTLNETIPALGHTEVTDNAVFPTCVQTGLSEGTHCSVCKKILKAREVIPALGHSLSDWQILVAPTEESGGTLFRICTVCNEIEQKEVSALHSHRFETETVEATCINSGFTKYTCADCGYSYISEHIPITEHNFVDTLNEPTTERKGYTVHTCKNCGYSFVDSITDVLPSEMHYIIPSLEDINATLTIKSAENEYSISSSTGIFEIDNIKGDVYRVYAKQKNSLTVCIGEYDTKNGLVTNSDVLIPLGDVNQDDVIDIADLSKLLAEGNYGEINPELNLFGDDTINISDICVILKAENYGAKSVEMI